MEPKSAPLIQRKLTDLIAYRGKSASFAEEKTGEVSVAEFLGHAHALAALLPQASYGINLCDNRYTFMVAFCALILRNQTNLLPANKALSTQSKLLSEYAGSYIIHDGVDIATGATAFNLAQTRLASEAARSIPDIDLDCLAAVTFTSGSTGKSKANRKLWRTFVNSTHINAHYMLADETKLFYQLATVPGQHMWGMETSVLLPLMHPVCVADSRPLFPADIARELNTLGENKMLVTTPVHLRAMVLSGLRFPQLARILCATAPLSKELAQSSEAAFLAPLHEVYGCSEVGSMAHRRTAHDSEWSIFHDISIVPIKNDRLESDDHPALFAHNAPTGHLASANHLPESILLHDKMEILGGRRFRLLGRNDDMIEIGGKRGSLQELNEILLKTLGVVDGVVSLSNEEKMVRRLVAVVVLDARATKDCVAEQFRQHVDPVFIPRPVYVVSELPREQNGKLPRKNIDALICELKNNS